MKRLHRAGVLSVLSVLLIAPAAFAAGAKGGSIECRDGYRTKVSSNTTKVGSTIQVVHTLNGSSVSWTTDGAHAYTWNVPGGAWLASTDDILNSAWASCVR